MIMRKCFACKEEKSIDNFYICSGRPASYCKECAREKAKNHFTKNKLTTHKYAKERTAKHIKLFRDFVDNIKLTYGCCACKQKYPAVSLDCHHLDSNNKEDEVAYYVRAKSKPKLLLELVKCVVVCANCHRQIHAGLINVSSDDLISLDGFDLTFGDNPFGKRRRKQPNSKTVKYLCPDCNKPVSMKNSRCRKCYNKIRKPIRRANWPTKEVLEKEIWEVPAQQLAKKYNISGRAIKKWCEAYGIKTPTRGYWTKQKFTK